MIIMIPSQVLFTFIPIRLQNLIFQYVFLKFYLAVPGLSYIMQTLSCGMWDLVLGDQGWNPGSLHWGYGILATRPQEKSPKHDLYIYIFFLFLRKRSMMAKVPRTYKVIR